MKSQTVLPHPSYNPAHTLIYYWLGLTALFLAFIGVVFYATNLPKLTLPTPKPTAKQIPLPLPSYETDRTRPSTTLTQLTVEQDVKIKEYFVFIDSVVKSYDSILPYKLTEYILVRNNPFIVDTLVNTDYDRMKLRDSFVYDQKQLVVLQKGTILNIPTLDEANNLTSKLGRTRLDINIPEFKLRVIEGEDTLYTFPVRVGQNRKRYLSEVKRTVDLRTRKGSGVIAFTYKKDYFVDHVEGKKFTVTKRDDGKTTLMPLQPWLEPKMNGELWGQLIHPTTNLVSVGKAFSNGCIGTREGDIWRIYYYAPVGTKVDVRYNLTVRDDKGNPLQMRHIYSAKSRKID